ncbi:hypothetical protein [Actinoplanes utahensis]|uniref:Alpha/beta hydrolase n=1 Tax=Actinoplanes utahensis TaxID=1869 RepID=A0A0A6UE53_ACTUT|nr:hypothetical protein [Actinoplanes utahensis]KHD74285.1 hypothetical protein MB27_29705 [Actinoplanes utahensis]GIF31575.1 alpha/beta hydrolase [Actinoplanes utahensis]
MRRIATFLATLVTCAAAALTAPATPAHAVAGSYSGTLGSGATWIADVPDPWNGTLILYSHGFGPLVPQNAPNPETRAALLAQGYALAGSSYSGPSLWALATAVDDQFATLHAVERITGAARRTIAWGTSMGGLVSALEAQRPRGLIDGALTTCGLVAGALNLNDYQLFGEYALARLLAPDQDIPLVRYADAAEASAAASALSAVVTEARATPAGRARIALGSALLNDPGTAPPLQFVMPARQQVELAAGGNSSATRGVDFSALLHSSPRAAEVRARYRDAGLDLAADLRTLTRDADITADRGAVVTLARTSMPTGRLGVPELTIHTTVDQLVPVEQENWYGKLVRRAGSGGLLRQAYVDATGHCAFRPGESIAALHALERRIDTGRWDAVSPEALNTASAALGDQGRFARYEPARLTGGLGEPR